MNETIYRFRPGIWINDLVFSSFLALVSLYLAVALLYHQIKVEKRLKGGLFLLPIEKRYGVLSKCTCIAIAIASVIRHINSIGLLLVEGSAVYTNASMLQITAAGAVCDVLPPIGNVALTVGSGLVYLFLWFRQRVFYVHSSLKVLNNKYVTVFSFAVLFFWILFWISLIFAYFIKVHYRFDTMGGCLFEEGTDIPYAKIIIAWTAVSVLMQISLLGLFIYPIIKRTLWRNQLSDGNVSLMRRVKKAVILASVCFGTDIFSIVILILVYEENANSAIFMYSVNLVINHLVTIVCFDHWKKLLLPWRMKCRKISTSVAKLNDAFPSTSLSSPQHHSKTTNFTENTSLSNPVPFAT